MAAIEVSELWVRYGQTPALRGVSLRVEPGELFTLLGPSGCGKTTLLRALAGFEPVAAGTLTLDGRSLAGVPPHRREVGLVFQSYALFPHLTVFENVAFGLRERRVPAAELAERVAAALEAVRLPGLGERLPGALSGGQQQRVAIARAIVTGPRLLLMDEPLSNLDARLRVELREEVRELQRARGITTIYVTHDQEEALAISDRIAVLEAGLVLQVGTPWEVYRRPRTVAVAEFVGQVSFLGPAAAAALGGRPDERLGARPVDLRLTAPDAGGEGALPGPARVARRAFSGPLVRYLVEHEGRRLLVEERGGAGAPLREPGQEVGLAVAPEGLLRFDAATGERRDP